jgi:tripartite-type tricarboxylate transporter receptor subunit TctC
MSFGRPTLRLINLIQQVLRNPMKLHQRVLALSLLGTGLLTALPAVAQNNEFPSRAIKLLVPFGAGTTTDTVTRIIAEAMARQLGQSIVVENKAGAGGTIGTELVARSAGDGYTLVMGTVGTHAINKSLFRKLSYDPARDFAPIALIGQTPTLLVVSAGSPLKTIKDLAAAAAKPPGINFASAGNGTSGHLAGELLKTRLGGFGDMVHVPYKEGSQALSDVISGQAQFMFYHPAAVVPHIKAGRLRALGASSAQRSAAAPEVATISEQLGSQFDLVAWFMLYAPASTPAGILNKLRSTLSAVLDHPEVMQKLSAQGVEKGSVTSTELAGFVQAEISKWAELVKQSGAQVD